MYKLIDPKLYLSIFAIVILTWLLYRGIKMKIRTSIIVFYVTGILGLCALILDIILGIFIVYDPGIDILLDYVRYAAGVVAALCIIYMGFMYGDDKQRFWTKLFSALLLIMVIALLARIL